MTADTADAAAAAVDTAAAPPAAPAANTDTDTKTTTCHILPCNIEYQGMAATHTFFRPVEFNSSSSSSGTAKRVLTGAGAASNDDDEDDDDEECDYVASTFRGRGLLAKKNTEYKNNKTQAQATSTNSKKKRPSSSPPSHDNDPDSSHSAHGCAAAVQPVLLSISTNNKRVRIKSSIDDVLEWYHESNPRTVEFAATTMAMSSSSNPSNSNSYSTTTTCSRVSKATEWLQVAKALHDPITSFE
mmetsp:Transcript_16651/g.40466  ORF Transcript_16651/g.40466 Transcript_16651/m.40466 type:complete len:243 (-) Transcript_16651:106-834(-)